jgi:calcium-translocating P-type ATPase
LENFKAF